MAILIWTPEKERLLRELWTTTTRPMAAKILGVSESAIYRKAQKLGLDRIPSMQKSRCGGRVDTETSRDAKATREFERTYRDAARRNGWYEHKYEGAGA